MYCDLDSMPSFFSEKWPVAKKEHICCECRSPILKGERYGYFSGKWQGDMMVFKQHLKCEEACRYIRDFLAGECICFGDLFNVWEDFIQDPGLRSIMSSVLWRAKKDRPLFFEPKIVKNDSLTKDRGFSDRKVQ